MLQNENEESAKKNGCNVGQTQKCGRKSWRQTILIAINYYYTGPFTFLLVVLKIVKNEE